MSGTQGVGKAKRILVVDDEAVILDLFAEILAAESHDIHKTSDPMEALEWIKEREFDVVISDFGMPSLSGDRFFDKATEIQPSLKDRFVFTSSGADPVDKSRFIQDAGVRVLDKPFGVKDVRSIIAKIIQDN